MYTFIVYNQNVKRLIIFSGIKICSYPSVCQLPCHKFGIEFQALQASYVRKCFKRVVVLVNGIMQLAALLGGYC